MFGSFGSIVLENGGGFSCALDVGTSDDSVIAEVGWEGIGWSEEGQDGKEGCRITSHGGGGGQRLECSR